MTRDLRKGDLGYVRGRTGRWVISGGAPNPDGIFPSSAEARRLSEATDPFAVWSPQYGTLIIDRDEFTLLADATQMT